MIKTILLSLSLLFVAQAHGFEIDLGKSLVKATVQDVNQGLDWTVGDTADYNLNMGFISGTLHSAVREEVDRGFWVQQDANLGPMGEQVIEILYDKNTGQVLEVIANGKKQTPPDPSDMELIEMKEANITVPAGTFDCIYVKVRDNKENKESEGWVNPEQIPVGGMIKTIAPGPFGEIVVELTGFNKQ